MSLMKYKTKKGCIAEKKKRIHTSHWIQSYSNHVLLFLHR